MTRASRLGARLSLAGALAAAVVSAVPVGCKGPRGPIVEVSVIADPDPEVVAEIFELVVTLNIEDRATEVLRFPVGGPGGSPISFPADFAIVASGVRGELSILIDGLDQAGAAVVHGLAFVQLDRAELVQVTVPIGVGHNCNNEVNDPGEVCFVREPSLPTGNFANGVVFADFDGSGALDILAAYGGDFMDPLDHSGVSMYLGSDIPGFGAQYDPMDPFDLPDATARGNIEVAVVNIIGGNDPILDPDPDFFNDIVVSAANAGELTIWPGRGNNTFDPPAFIALAATEEPGEIRIADLPGDPGTEIFVAERETGELHIFGHPIAMMPPGDVATPLPVGVGARGFVVVDLDGDLDLDVVVAAKGVTETMVPGDLTIHINQGGGVFAAPVSLTTETGLRDVAVLDLDGDGVLDLATVNEDLGVLATWRGTSPTSFDTPVSYSLYTAAEPERIRTGDVDGDGIVDLLACDRALGSIFILLMSATGTPASPPIRLKLGADVGVVGDDIQGCDVADTDMDGVIDRIAVVERSFNVIRVLRSTP